MFEWTSFGHLKEKPDAKTVAALTGTAKDGPKLSVDIVGDRTAMLVDLAELMTFVAQGK